MSRWVSVLRGFTVLSNSGRGTVSEWAHIRELTFGNLHLRTYIWRLRFKGLAWRAYIWGLISFTRKYFHQKLFLTFLGYADAYHYASIHFVSGNDSQSGIHDCIRPGSPKSAQKWGIRDGLPFDEDFMRVTLQTRQKMFSEHIKSSWIMHVV